MPWFLTLFGRDSIWAARMLLPLGTELAEGTLRTLARRQGTAVDDRHRRGAREDHARAAPRRRRWSRRAAAATRRVYYGTVDATLLWISLLADAWRWGLPETDGRRPAAPPAPGPVLAGTHGDPDGDGFVEYLDATGRGLANQGWKDSFNAVRFHDGRLAGRRSRCARCRRTRTGPPSTRPRCSMRSARAGAGPLAEYAARLADRFRAAVLGGRTARARSRPWPSTGTAGRSTR